MSLLKDKYPKDYKGLAVEKISAEVTAEDIEKVKKNLLDRKAEVAAVNRAIKTGDMVDFKYEGKLKTDKGMETQPNLSGERNAEIGSGQLLPAFEKNMIGLKAGENKSFKMTYEKFLHVLLKPDLVKMIFLIYMNPIHMA
jgi:trigger factor